MRNEEGVAVLLACMEDYERAADEPLRGNLGYEEVIEALTAALFGDWSDAVLH